MTFRSQCSGSCKNIPQPEMKSPIASKYLNGPYITTQSEANRSWFLSITLRFFLPRITSLHLVWLYNWMVIPSLAARARSIFSGRSHSVPNSEALLTVVKVLKDLFKIRRVIILGSTFKPPGEVNVSGISVS